MPNARRREISRAYYERNRETCLERNAVCRDRRRARPEVRQEEARKAREYRKNNPDKMKALWSRRSQRAMRRRYWIGKYKTAMGCEMCGYNQHPVALQFDHLVPHEKEFAIAAVSRRTIPAVIAEIRKCRVLCANCHAIHTYNQNKEKQEDGAEPSDL